MRPPGLHTLWFQIRSPDFFNAPWDKCKQNRVFEQVLESNALKGYGSVMRWLNVQMPRKCTVMCSDSEHKTPTHPMKLCGGGWSFHGAATAERHSSTSSSSLSPLVQVCPSFSIAPRGPGSGLELWFDDFRDWYFISKTVEQQLVSCAFRVRTIVATTKPRVVVELAGW